MSSVISYINFIEKTDSSIPAFILKLLELPAATLWKRMTSLGFEPRTFPLSGVGANLVCLGLPEVE